MVSYYTAWPGSEPTHIADIDGANTQDLCALANSGDLLCDTLRLFNIASDDTGIGTEVDQRLGLDTADGASTARYENDLVVWERG